MSSQVIPIITLKTALPKETAQYSKSILENEIKGILVEHIVIIGGNTVENT